MYIMICIVYMLCACHISDYSTLLTYTMNDRFLVNI